MGFLEKLDIVGILSLGAIGFGFLLAVLCYRLLTKEQHRDEPRRVMIVSIVGFMGFSVILIVLGIVGKNYEVTSEEPSSIALEEEFQSTKDKFGFGVADQFNSGTVDINIPAELNVKIPKGGCRSALAMAPKGYRIAVEVKNSDTDDAQLDKTVSKNTNLELIKVCAKDSDVSINFLIQVERLENPFRIETFLIN